MFYLTTTAKRKNAKRHISDKSNSINDLERLALNINKKRYTVEICNGKWELIKVIK